MKFRKILLVLGIVALASVFVMNASFAASSEKLSVYKGYYSFINDKKVSTIEQVVTFNNESSKQYYKINIKKTYQKKYKIKSVNIKYAVFDNKTDEFKNYIYKNYTANNKNSFVINPLINEWISFDKLTVNYQTKEKIKKESVSFSSKPELKYNIYFTSNKANAQVFQKIYIKNGIKYPFAVKYQKLKVLTKSNKYKIKSIKLTLATMKNHKISYKTLKGYGKNSFKLQLYQNKLIQDIKVYYY